MTNAEKLATKAAIDANPHLFSARRNKDYETMASVLNDALPKDKKLTPLQVHECMDTPDPVPSQEPPAA